jgi:hypothetical protein
MMIPYIVVIAGDEVAGPFPTMEKAQETFLALRYVGCQDLQIMPEYMAPKRPRDPIQLAKSIIDIATGQQ